MRKNGKNISTQPGQDSYEDPPESRESFPESEGTPRPRFLEMQGALNKIDHKSRYLRGQHIEIIGKENKQYASSQTDTVFPEIFIKCLELFQKMYLMRK